MRRLIPDSLWLTNGEIRRARLLAKLLNLPRAEAASWPWAGIRLPYPTRCGLRNIAANRTNIHRSARLRAAPRPRWMHLRRDLIS